MCQFSKIVMVSLVALFMVINTAGCTENQRAKDWGGNLTVTLPKGQKLVIATWKNNDLWYLTRTIKDGEQPETSSFVEDSSWGLMKGEVTFIESR